MGVGLSLTVAFLTTGAGIRLAEPSTLLAGGALVQGVREVEALRCSVSRKWDGMSRRTISIIGVKAETLKTLRRRLK